MKGRGNLPTKRVGRIGALTVLAVMATGCLGVDDRSDGSPSRRSLAEMVAGSGITRVANAETAGRGRSIGTFTDGTEAFGVDHGVVLSTGRADAVVASSTPVDRSTDNRSAGDADADDVLPFGVRDRPTVDAATLEFDFVPSGDRVRFSYVVASDDARPGTHDVAVVRVNGQWCGIGRGEVTTPLPADPAPPAGSTALDRVAEVETCRTSVVAGQVNHLKVTVADHADGALDTVVLVGAGSLAVEPEPSFDVTVDPIVHVDGATGRAVVTGTFVGCNRTFDIVADPDVGLQQSPRPGGPEEFGHIGRTRCRPGATVPWSAAVPNGVGGSPSPPFVAGPGRVDAYFVAYETDGEESDGSASATRVPVTVVIDR